MNYRGTNLSRLYLHLSRNNSLNNSFIYNKKSTYGNIIYFIIQSDVKKKKHKMHNTQTYSKINLI